MFGQGTITKLSFPESADNPAPKGDEKLVSLVVTISDSSSYDELFSRVPQKVGEGERSEQRQSALVESFLAYDFEGPGQSATGFFEQQEALIQQLVSCR